MGVDAVLFDKLIDTIKGRAPFDVVVGLLYIAHIVEPSQHILFIFMLGVT